MRRLSKRRLRKLYTFLSSFRSAFAAPFSPLASVFTGGQWTFVRPLPIMKKINYLGRNHPSAAGPEIHHQPAQDRLSHEGQPAPERARGSGPLGANGHLPAHTGSPARGSELRLARRSALRQWTHPYGPCAEQVPERFHRQVQNHGRIWLSLRSRMGLSWPTYRN